MWVYDPRTDDYVQKLQSDTAPVAKVAPGNALAKARARAAARSRARDRARAEEQNAARRAAAERAAAALQQRDEQARRRAPVERAKAVDYQQRVADARRRSYETLRTETNQILRRTGIVPSRLDRERADRSDAVAEQTLQARNKRTVEVARAVENRYRASRDRALANPDLSDADIRGWLDREAERAAAGKADSEFVGKLWERYEARADVVAKRWRKIVDEFQRSADGDESTRTPEQIMRDPATTAAWNEVVRVFGDPDDSTKEGELAATARAYQRVDAGLTDWYKRQTRAAMDSDYTSAKRQLEEEMAKGSDADQIRIRQARAVIAALGPVSPSVRVRKNDGGWETKQLSVDEQVAIREARYKALQEKEYSQAIIRREREQRLFRAEGLTRDPAGRVVDRADMPAIEHAIAWQRAHPDAPVVKTSEQLQGRVSDLMAQWQSRNPPPVPSEEVRRVGVARSDAYKAQVRAYELRKRDYEAALYRFYGSATPQWWERALSAPGISHGLALLQAPFSAMGTGARVLTKAVTGESELNLGWSMDELPAQVRAAMATARNQQDDAPRAGYMYLAGGGGVERSQRVLRQWLASDAGKAWLADWQEKRRQRLAGEDAAFSEALYGGGVDPATVAARVFSGDGLNALNEFGWKPTSSTGVNLLLSFALDPLNAIPLKFGTYAARAAFAAERRAATMARLAGNATTRQKLGSAYQLWRDFRGVDEGVLKARKYRDALEKQLALAGGDEKRLVEELLGELSGVKEKSARDVVIEDFLREKGFDRRLVSAKQVDSMVQLYVLELARQEGRAVLSMSDIARETRRRADQEAEAARVAAAGGAAQAAARTARRRADAQAAGATLDAGKEAEVARAQAKVDELKAKDRQFQEQEQITRDRESILRERRDRRNAQARQRRADRRAQEKAAAQAMDQRVGVQSASTVAAAGAPSKPTLVARTTARARVASKADQRVDAIRAKSRSLDRSKSRGAVSRETIDALDEAIARVNPLLGRQLTEAQIRGATSEVFNERYNQLVPRQATSGLSAREKKRLGDLAVAARKGDVRAADALRVWGRKQRNEFLMRQQDRFAGGPAYVRTPFDVIESSGVDVTDTVRRARYLEDRKTVGQILEQASDLVSRRTSAGGVKKGLAGARRDKRVEHLSRYVLHVDRGVGFVPPVALAKDVDKLGLKSALPEGARESAKGKYVMSPRFGEGVVLSESRVAQGAARGDLAPGNTLYVEFAGGKRQRVDAGLPRYDYGELLPQERVVDPLDAVRADVVEIGADIVDAVVRTKRLDGLYQPFTLDARRVAQFEHPLFERLRGPGVAQLTREEFGVILAALDQLADGVSDLDSLGALGKMVQGFGEDLVGIAAFREGGQLLHQIFHTLRRRAMDGQVSPPLRRQYMDKLRKLSQYVAAYDEQVAARAGRGLELRPRGGKSPVGVVPTRGESLFVAQWRVMEARANLPWAVSDEYAEAAFMEAAEVFGLHPELALGMIPHGAFAYGESTIFQLMPPLRAARDAGLLQFHEPTWTLTDARRAIDTVFDGSAPPGTADQIVSYIAARFGTVDKAFQIRPRVLDSVTKYSLRVLGEKRLLDVLLGDDLVAAVAQAYRVSGEGLTRDEWLGRIRARVAADLSRDPGSQLGAGNRARQRKVPRRFEASALRMVIRDAWRNGALPIDNPEVHKLLLFLELQQDARRWQQAVFAYSGYMLQLGKGKDASALIRTMFAPQIADAQREYARYMSGTLTRLGASGNAPVAYTDTLEFALMDRLNLLPQGEQLDAMVAAVRGDRTSEIVDPVRQRAGTAASDTLDPDEIRELELAFERGNGLFEDAASRARNDAGLHERDLAQVRAIGPWVPDRVAGRFARALSLRNLQLDLRNLPGIVDGGVADAVSVGEAVMRAWPDLRYGDLPRRMRMDGVAARTNELFAARTRSASDARAWAKYLGEQLLQGSMASGARRVDVPYEKWARRQVAAIARRLKDPQTPKSARGPLQRTRERLWAEINAIEKRGEYPVARGKYQPARFVDGVKVEATWESVLVTTKTVLVKDFAPESVGFGWLRRRHEQLLRQLADDVVEVVERARFVDARVGVDEYDAIADVVRVISEAGPLDAQMVLADVAERVARSDLERFAALNDEVFYQYSGGRVVEVKRADAVAKMLEIEGPDTVGARQKLVAKDLEKRAQARQEAGAAYEARRDVDRLASAAGTYRGRVRTDAADVAPSTPAGTPVASAPRPPRYRGQQLPKYTGPLVNPLSDTERAQLAHAEALIRSLTGMTQEAYWTDLWTRAAATLRDPRATDAAKASARRTQSLVRRARWWKNVAQSTGTAADHRARRAFSNRVVALHGKELEDLHPPQLVAGFVADEVAVVVEESRALYRATRGYIEDPAVARGRVFLRGAEQDFVPRDVWMSVTERVQEAIVRARLGKRADWTSFKGLTLDAVDDAPVMGGLRDVDPKVVAAKEEELAAIARDTGWVITVDAYDELRKVLRVPMVRGNNARYLMRKADQIVTRFGGEYDKVYLRLRERAAREQARKLLSNMAFGPYFGATPAQVAEAFRASYHRADEVLMQRPVVSPLQMRTMQEHFRALSGVAHDDLPRVRTWLGSRNKPPLERQDLMRDFMVSIGAWTPRKGDLIAEGKASWSVFDEEAWWLSNYADVPEWAVVANWRAGGALYDGLLYPEVMDQHLRRWGVYTREPNQRARLKGRSIEEQKLVRREGDPELGIKAKRDVVTERRYMMERYGELVHRDGKLWTVPWLMNETELMEFTAERMRLGLPMADELFQTSEEVAEAHQLMVDLVERYRDKLFGGPPDVPVRYDEVFEFAGEITARIMANPTWAKRSRDLLGGALEAWATIWRFVVFGNPAFAAMGSVDSLTKGAYYRMTRRSVFNPDVLRVDVPLDVAERAKHLSLANFGLDTGFTQYEFAARSVKDYVLNPTQKGLAGVLERASGPFRALNRMAPVVATRVEAMTKLQLARGMYPQVYATMRAGKLSDDAADLAARKYIRDELRRMWPTQGDGPLERLYNQFAPFASYSIKNKVLYISEAMAHPVWLNRIAYAGKWLEDHNRRAWEREHPGEEMPYEVKIRLRQVELPWAPGVYLDLGSFSDATRGLAPLFGASRERTVQEEFFSWVRVFNPSTVAAGGMVFNAFGSFPQERWVPTLDKYGFVTGYERKVVPWTEPWSDKGPTLASVNWFADAVASGSAFWEGGLTSGEVSQLVGKVLLFGSITDGTPDRGGAYLEYYKVLRAKDPEAARRWWDETPEGRYLQSWLQTFARPRDVSDWAWLAVKWDDEPDRWFRTQSEEFKGVVRNAYDLINRIRDDYADRLLSADYGSDEYRRLRAEMRYRIQSVYQATPELLVHEVYSKSAGEWSQQLADWWVDDMVDRYMGLYGQAPRRDQFKSVAEYNAARADYEKARLLYLKTYPQVEARLASGRQQLSGLRDQVEREWNAVLDRVAKRSELAEAALKADDREKADLLYLQNTLDMSLLEIDTWQRTFGQDDFERLAKGVLGPEALRPKALANLTLAMDFNARARQKAEREGRLSQYLDDEYYRRAMGEIVLAAKKGDRLGKFDPAVFVRELKKRSRLLKLYFEKNPGKEKEWAQSGEYLSLIAPWGKAANAGDWDRAERLWAALPQWVKDRYYETNKIDKKAAVAAQEYRSYMKRWVAYFEAGDNEGAMKYFWSMPSSVRERYFAKYPEKRIKYEAELKYRTQLVEYFAADGEAARTAYLAAHPDLARWLAANASDEEAERTAIMQAYRMIEPTDTWLKRVYRERYPEIFSPEAVGERRLRRVFDKLAAHPEMTAEFERWVEKVWASYAEMVKHHTPKRPDIELDRSRRNRRARVSLSGAELRA